MDHPVVGSTMHFVYTNGMERHIKILGYDDGCEMTLVRAIDYNVPDEWIPTRQILDQS